MVEHAADYEWRGEGEEAEIALYAPDAPVAGSAFERILPAARLPGVESPVHAVASPEGLGWAAVSASHAAPDLTSIPLRGLLLVADAALESLGVPPDEAPRLIPRRLSEVRLPRLTGSGIRRICETGARGAAEDGLIEEEDLPLLEPLAGDADALGRQAISAGDRDPHPGETYACGVGEVLDAGGTDSLGLSQGAFVLVVAVGAGDLGRLALAGHRDRIAGRVRGGGRSPGGAARRGQLRGWPGGATGLRAAAGARGLRRWFEPSRGLEGWRDSGAGWFTRAS